MQTIDTLFKNRRIGIISAHPDDHLIHSAAIAAARRAGAPVYELTLTQGRASTINFNPDQRFVRHGKRVQEGIAAAALLGIRNNEHAEFDDGQLHLGNNPLLTPHRIKAWAQGRSIDTLLTLGGLHDHTDHQASAGAAQRAAGLLLHENGMALTVLAVQADGNGDWRAPVSTETIHSTFSAAALHASQFMVAATFQPGWVLAAEGLYAHPHTAEGLSQYPITTHAAYRHVPAITIHTPPARAANTVY